MRGFRIFDHTEKVGGMGRKRPHPEGALTWIGSKAEWQCLPHDTSPTSGAYRMTNQILRRTMLQIGKRRT